MKTRDLISGLAALQLGKADAAGLAKAYQAYAAQGGGDWAAHLTDAGGLSAADAGEVLAFTQQLVQACANDERAALDVLGGLEKAREVFQNATPCMEPEGLTHLQRGTTLRQLIERSHTLAERMALLPLFAEACRIVSAAHARGTVHRNLQPGTIVVGACHSVTVTDWSTGRLRGKQDAMGDALVQTVQRLRNDEPADDALAIGLDPAYLSPELALAHIEDIDARSDVYALGAILYTLLTGKAPFSGGKSGEILHAVGSRKPEPVTSAQPAAPAELAALCERAMHQEPSARYASAKQLADELGQFLHAPSARPRERSAQPAWPYALLGACAMGLVTLVVAFLYAGAANKASDAFRSVATLEQKCNQITEERDKLARDLEDAQQARQQMQAERDEADQARARLQDSAKRSEEAQRKAKPKEPAPEPATAIATDDKPALPVETPADKAAAEPVPAPEPAPEPAPAPVAPAPPSDANQHPPGLTKAEYAKGLPELIASLKDEPGADGKTAVVVRPGTPDTEADLARLQFKDGDVITNINRGAVDSLEHARKVLETLRQDPGFNVRILRNGQPSVMRVNVVDAAPPKPAAEAPAAHTGNTKPGGLTLITPQGTRPLAPDEKPEEAVETPPEEDNAEK